MSVVRSALAGAATGGRTFSGIGALVATVPRGTREQPDATLAKPQTQAVIGLLAAGEVLADKLPFAPSRMDFPGLQGRILFGAVCGAVIAHRSASVAAQVALPSETVALPSEAGAVAPVVSGRREVPPARVAACAVVGAAAAVAGSWLGVRFRGLTGRNRGLRILGAIVEDAAVVSLSAAAVRAPNPAFGR